MWKGPEVTVVPVTVELARQINQLSRVPGDRPVQRQRLAWLKGEIEAKRLISFHWVIAQLGDVQYRINGQHTAMLFANGTSPAGTAIVQRYYCDTLEDVVRLWTKFDAQKSSRTKAEKLHSVAEADGRFSGVSQRVLNLSASAAAIRCYGFGYANKVADEKKFDALQRYAAFVLWANNMFPHRTGPANGGFVLRVGVFYPALVTWEMSETKATEFWDHVLLGSAENPKDATRVLRELLLTYNVANGRGSGSGKRTLRWDEMADLCLSAWHLYWKKANVSHLRMHKDGLAGIAPPPICPQSDGVEE